MIRSLKSAAVAIALTCSVAAGATLTAAVAAPASAEAGVFSSVKTVVKTTVKTPWIGSKIVVKKVFLPVFKIFKKKLPPIVCVRAPCSR